MRINRPIVAQPILNYALTVLITPTPVNVQDFLTAYVDTILVCLPSTAANSIFWGNESVTLASGLEITPGNTVSFATVNERQLYELQKPLLKIACDDTPEGITFVTWNCTSLNLIAAANTDVRIALFKNPFV